MIYHGKSYIPTLKPTPWPLGPSELARNCEAIGIPWRRVPVAFTFWIMDAVNLGSYDTLKTITMESAEPRDSAMGFGVGCSDTTRAYREALWNPFSTSSGAGQGDFAYLFGLDSPSQGTRGVPFHVRNDSNPWASIVCIDNGYTSDGGSSSTDEAGTLYCGTFYQLYSKAQGVRVTNVFNGMPHYCLFARRSLVYEIWVDGTLQGSADKSGIGGIHDVQEAQDFSLLGWESSDGYASPGTMPFFVGFDIAPTERQCELLTSNPWILFRKPRVPVYFDAGAVSGDLTAMPSDTNTSNWLDTREGTLTYAATVADDINT